MIEGVGLETPYNNLLPGTLQLLAHNPLFGSSLHNLVRLQLIQTGLTQYYGLNDDIINSEGLQLTPFGFMFASVVNRVDVKPSES